MNNIRNSLTRLSSLPQVCLRVHTQRSISYTKMTQSSSDKIIEEKTPFGRFSDAEKTETKTEEVKKDPYAKFPDATNPETGEIGGPLGPEPTRYGDWERKGRCSDF